MNPRDFLKDWSTVQELRDRLNKDLLSHTYKSYNDLVSDLKELVRRTNCSLTITGSPRTREFIVIATCSGCSHPLHLIISLTSIKVCFPDSARWETAEGREEVIKYLRATVYEPFEGPKAMTSWDLLLAE